MGMNSDTADSIEEEQYKGVINTVISECLDINNARRRQRGEEEVEQQWYELNDELPFEHEMLSACMCYGVGSRLYIDEAGDEANMVSFLETNYEAGKNRFFIAEYVPVKGGMFNGTD